MPSIGKNGRQLRDGLLLMAEEAPLPVNLLRGSHQLRKLKDSKQARINEALDEMSTAEAMQSLTMAAARAHKGHGAP